MLFMKSAEYRHSGAGRAVKPATIGRLGCAGIRPTGEPRDAD